MIDGWLRDDLDASRRGAGLLFQVLTEREEANSIAVASNAGFSDWTNTFTDPGLCAAIVDRLTFGGNVIGTGSTSYRIAHTMDTGQHHQSDVEVHRHLSTIPGDR